ncbi:MAG: glycyl-radical enzyme activating protein [Candidatus Odinarchaeota archaeon]
MKSKNRKSNKGLLFNIQRYSIHDGPGIRTIVFFKGCPLSCLWCQNPEGLSRKKELAFNKSKCIGCGNCEQVCPLGSIDLATNTRIDRRSCNACGKCADVCFAGALTIFGMEMTVEQILVEVEKDSPFYERTGGGITLSGGEPALQADFVLELLKESKLRGLNTAMETCGYFNWENFEPLLEYLDWILFDLKVVDEKEHQKFCGVVNAKILENCRKIAERADGLIIRMPVIPGINDGKKNIKKTCQFLKELGLKEIHLIPYHKLGVDKYQMLGKKPRDSHVTRIGDKMTEKVRKRILEEGIKPVWVS